MSEVITLPRSGQTPLTFTGKLLARCDGQETDRKVQIRYHDLALYLADEPPGLLVLSVQYHSHWIGKSNQGGEHGLSLVTTHATIGSMVRQLRDYNPCTVVMGFPPGEEFAAKQARLLADIKARYEAQVSELLAAYPERLAEVGVAREGVI